MANYDASNEKLEKEFLAFTDLENICRDYYLKHGRLYPVDAFFEVVRAMEKQGGVLFRCGSIGIDSSDGEMNLTEVLFDDSEDVSIGKHPRYNPEFIHQHQFFEITYVLSGHCRHTIYSSGTPEPVECVAGDMLIMSPGMPHSILVQDDDSIILDVLVRKSSFDKAFLKNIPETTVLADFFISILYSPNRTNYILFHTGEDQRIRNLLFEIYSEHMEAQAYYPVLMNLLLAQLFMYVLRGYNDSVTFSREYPREIDYIPMIIQYIDANYAWITVRDIAKHFNFSLSHLSRIYKAYTNTTLSEALRIVRIKKAAEFLLGTSKSVEEIAGMIGYQDTTSFIRRFKQCYGQTPKRYRTAKQTVQV